MNRTLASLAGVALGAAALRARNVPLSPLTAAGRVGADWPERQGLARGPVAGEMDDMADYARPEFDPGRVHPTVRAFYEQTSEFEMAYETVWHRPFRTGAALAARVTTWLRQLNLPAPGAGVRRLDSRLVELDPAADPRDDVRAWVRTDPETDEAVFVAVYGSHVTEGERFTNIAAPLPGANLSTVLRLQHLGAGDETGVELTTFAPGDPGLYLVVPPAAVELPMAQRFRVAPAASALVASPDAEFDPALTGTHEMWAAGAKFLTVRYAIR